ncbi:MAG: PAS domain S-box protein [Mesorhizobium sp.]|uniref:LuxR C-terminal-related transcriptional regulator n=1 Tax=Mesorhizobium sp. TaxID=1871066 RepID=UPI000FE7847E|nr:LuxR C-terminal-related transcriptional regulator [Mesorhizobium sp.]RWI36990.1 MAG: PAS domain S-box protein [Mesorhizobium sp.]RWI63297.1 MAG: PAS domain S-box protein [Mesorhizobium sp.]RWI82570.1 MAG: PAS domain S-box protein [Mesorhizobium sp.]RWJ46748.1 MAG: PAS domain S-box protein [Mesorhizobium sp.]RWJ57481.1 MAG: PAS domain S-box protein [Mesorhizobium sp.]
MPGSPRAQNLGNLDRIGFLNAPDATLVLSNRVILRASYRVQFVFGWSIREVEGESMRVLYPGQADYEVIGEKARRAMQTDPVYCDTRFMRRKDGEIVWMEAHGAALDRDNPQELAIWSYRPVAVEQTQGHSLTAAEVRIARYLVNGFTSKEMARSIGCSPRTVEVHRANMIAKFRVRNTSELVARLLAAR